VLTVIIFGGTTARMLEILNIKTGVVEEIDSDDEFDIEYVVGGGNGNGLANGTYVRRSGTAFGHNPRYTAADAIGTVPLGTLRDDSNANTRGTYSSGNSPPTRPDVPARRNSARSRGVGSDRTVDAAEQGLLSPGNSLDDEYDGDTDLDLPPAAKRVSPSGRSPNRPEQPTTYPTAGTRETHSSTPQGRLAGATAAVTGMTGAVSQLISGISADPASAFRQIDESFIKPRLLLDPGGGNGDRGHGNGSGGS
jgi:sodium/hydrogen exchanger-like protein 6/7